MSPQAGLSPLVIGGVGGSGTRVYRGIAEAAGYPLLASPWPVRWYKREHQHDTLLMRYFYSRWADRYLLGELSRFGRWRMRTTCRLSLWASGPRSYERGKWGWKNPRSALLIPFFNDLYPSMAYIHVIRDGRDLAFHPRFSYTAHERVTNPPREEDLEDHVRRAMHWVSVNDRAETACRQHLAGRYLQSRLEDLCENPHREVGRILSFLGVDDEAAVERAANLVSTPRSLGRWKAEAADRIAEVEAAIGPDLERFGYVLSPKDL